MSRDREETAIELAVVMPTYNEVEAIESVVREWLSALHDSRTTFCLYVLDDGSTDGTGTVLASLATNSAALRVIAKKNTGHGQTCISGYREAIASGANWILQIDSDGQCDPRHLPEFLKARKKGAAIQGFRKIRGDGLVRMGISSILSSVVFFMTGKYLKDANVPYRLMDRDSLAKVVDLVPESFYLANILVSYLYARLYRIEWQEIDFRVRTGGKTKTNLKRIASLAWQFIQQLREFNSQFKTHQTGRFGDRLETTD